MKKIIILLIFTLSVYSNDSKLTNDKKNIKINQNKSKTDIINLDNEIQVRKSNKFIIINGDGNILKYTGTCKEITINGDNNNINIENISIINFNGDNNTIKYKNIKTNTRPKIYKIGNKNKVFRVKFKKEINQ